MKRSNQIRIGVIISYLQMGLGVFIQLFYTPLMIRFLGTSEYGLYNTVSSAISMLGVLSLGFNAGYIKYYSIYKQRDDRLSIQKLNGLMLLVFAFIGMIGMICGLFLSFHLDYVFDKGLTNQEYNTAHVLMLLLTLNLAISFPMSVFQNIISAHERFIFLKVVGMIKTVCSPLITLPLLLFGFRSIALVAVTVGLSLVADVFYLYYVLNRMKERFIFRDFESGLLRNIFFYTFFIAINSLINQINWNIDKLLLARFKGTSHVAIYSVGYTLYSCYMKLSTSISGVFTPRVHRIVNETDEDTTRQKRELTDLFIKVGRIQFIILAFIVIGIILYGKFFITKIWAGEEYLDSYYVSLFLILPASIALIQNIGIEIQRAQNKHQFRSIVYFIMAILNLGISIYLCQIYGAVGSAVGTAISLLVANGIIMNVYYHKKCSIDILAFWKSIGRLARGIVIPIFAGVLVRQLFQTATLSTFILEIALYTVIYCFSIWFLGMNDYEKIMFLHLFKGLHGDRKDSIG